MTDRKSPPNLLGSTTPLAPPLYQASTYVLPDLDALDRIIDAGEPGFFYARDSHPNARELAAEVARLEGATWSVVCSSGMAANSSLMLATLEPGQGIAATQPPS